MKLEKTVKYCPVTGNQPLKCTRRGFIESCKKFQANSAAKKFQRNAAGGTKPFNNYCLTCAGTIPDNVTFIDITQEERGNKGSNPGKNKKEKPVGSAKRVQGTCHSCGGDKKVSVHFGKMVCSSCMPIRIGAKNYPELTVAALREFGNIPEMEKLSQPDDGLSEQLQSANVLISEKDREIATLNKTIEEHKEELRVLTAPSSFLEYASEAVTMDDSSKTILNNIIWKLAEGLMQGDISGVEVEDIRALRGLL